LTLLLCADVAFLLLHVVSRTVDSPNVLFSLATDAGYPELFQYIKEYWIAIALFSVCWRTREGIYGTWALLFTYLLCDDALQIHEKVGEAVARRWNYSPGVGLTLGELSISVVVGSAFLVLITYFYLRCSHSARNVSKDLALLLGLLVFFGVFVDMVSIVIGDLRGLPVRGVITIEDGGEMITMSMIAGYVVRLLERRGHVPGLLWRTTVAALSRRCSRGAKARGQA
jgi:hypothetical protein